MKLYDFNGRLADGKTIDFSDYKGKVVLVVNVASKCGFTKQYEGLQSLYAKYKDQGLVILGFPSNQFKNQEPGSNAEVQSFCKMNFGVEFPVFEKGDVKGDDAHPLFAYLADVEKKKVPWNFTKFLFDADGEFVKRYLPVTKPERLEKAIEKLLP